MKFFQEQNFLKNVKLKKNSFFKIFNFQQLTEKKFVRAKCFSKLQKTLFNQKK